MLLKALSNKMTANYLNFTEQYLDLLGETLKKNPQELGYDFDRWTAHRLSIYLTHKTGIKLTSIQIRKILVANNYIKNITS